MLLIKIKILHSVHYLRDSVGANKLEKLGVNGFMENSKESILSMHTD